MGIRIKTYGSSSKGNCYIIDDGKTRLCLEAGINVKKMMKKGESISKIMGCFISHYHL